MAAPGGGRDPRVPRAPVGGRRRDPHRCHPLHPAAGDRAAVQDRPDRGPAGGRPGRSHSAARPLGAAPAGALATRARAWILVAQAALVFATFAAGLATMAAAWAGHRGCTDAGSRAVPRRPGPRRPGAALCDRRRRFGPAHGGRGGAVQAAAGTTSFAAVPPDSITPAAAGLLLTLPLMALAGGGLLLRASRPGISLVAAWAILVAAGAGAMVRLYDVGGGQLPGVGLRPVLVVVGGVAALGLALAAWWAADLAARLPASSTPAAAWSWSAPGLAAVLAPSWLWAWAWSPCSLRLFC